MATRAQIEEDLKGNGDFVKIDHLNRFLKDADSLDTKKFILAKLANIYEAKGFFSDAAKNYDAAAEIVATFKEKIEFYMKETELYVKLGQFEIADAVFKKAYAFGNTREKLDCQAKYAQFYYVEAEKHEKAMRIRKAAEVYEKIYSMTSIEERRLEAKKKLLELYNKLGNMKEYNLLSGQTEKKANGKHKIQAGRFENLGIRKY